jgi:hypothetical protein
MIDARIEFIVKAYPQVEVKLQKCHFPEYTGESYLGRVSI